MPPSILVGLTRESIVKRYQDLDYARMLCSTLIINFLTSCLPKPGHRSVKRLQDRVTASRFSDRQRLARCLLALLEPMAAIKL